MAGVTLAQAESQLAIALTSLEKYQHGQEGRRGDRVTKRAELKDAKDLVVFWNSMVKDLTNSPDGNFSVRGGVPTDA